MSSELLAQEPVEAAPATESTALASSETIALSQEDAAQIVDLIRDLRERVHLKQEAQPQVEAEPEPAPTGFRAALRNAFGGA